MPPPPVTTSRSIVITQPPGPPNPPTEHHDGPPAVSQLQEQFSGLPWQFNPGWKEQGCIQAGDHPPTVNYLVAPPHHDQFHLGMGNTWSQPPINAIPPLHSYYQLNDNAVQHLSFPEQHQQGQPLPHYRQAEAVFPPYLQYPPGTNPIATMATIPDTRPQSYSTGRKRAAETDNTPGQSSSKRAKSKTQPMDVIDLTSSPTRQLSAQTGFPQPEEFRSFAQLAAENNFSQSSVSNTLSSGPTHASNMGSQNISQATGGKKTKKARNNKKRKEAGEPELCPEQRDLVNKILSGSNVFYTGSAGCGKSTVLKAAVRELREMGKDVRIVAPTGRAAVDIGGTTIHAFAGITPDSMKLPLKQLVQKAHGRTVYKRLRDTDVLVFDEISMVENHLLERLSEMLKMARAKPEKAFGGVQVVMLGDFYQLPPVKPFAYCIECGFQMTEKVAGMLYKCPQSRCRNHKEDFHDEDKWAFRSKCWADANFECVNLKSIHRQKDKKFISILEKCRTGQTLSEKDKNTLLNHKCNVNNAVRLFATREEVRRVNEAEFAKLTTAKLAFKCLDGIRVQDHHEHQLRWKTRREPDDTLVALKEHRFERLLELKVGMLVILLVNLDMDAGLINGSQGIIQGWEEYDEKNLPKIADPKDSRKEPNPSRPLIFGEYAGTKLESIKVFMKRAPVKKWPVVKFDNGISRTIMAECTVSELGDEKPYSYQCRTQIPLLPAWAMSIHKSQGMTLNKVIVDLARNFEEGQTYVALSRARSLHGLKVESLGRLTRGPNEQVIKFLEEQFGSDTEPQPAEE